MRSRAPLSFVTSRVFSYCANDPAICRIMTREGSLVSVRSSPLAVSTLTFRLIGKSTPSSWATRSRANRLASSTTTVWTPLPSMRSSRAEKPGRYFNRVCAAHGRVVEPIDDFQASRKSLDSHPLALLAVLVCPDLRLRCDKRETLNELPDEPYPQLLWDQKVDRVWQFVFSRYPGPQVSSSDLT